MNRQELPIVIMDCVLGFLKITIGCRKKNYEGADMSKTKRLTPLQAVKAWCKECVGGSRFVSDCGDPFCPLYPYRFGKNPARKGMGPREGPPSKTGPQKAS